MRFEWGRQNYAQPPLERELIGDRKLDGGKWEREGEPAAKGKTPIVERESFTRKSETEKETARWWWSGIEREPRGVVVSGGEGENKKERDKVCERVEIEIGVGEDAHREEGWRNKKRA